MTSNFWEELIQDFLLENVCLIYFNRQVINLVDASVSFHSISICRLRNSLQ